MNEQKKRELMLKAVVQFKGEWPKATDDSIPNDKEPLVLLCKESYLEDGEYIEGLLYAGFDGFNKNLFDKVCTRDEFEALMHSLFEGAPDGATHYRSEDGVYIRKSNGWLKWNGIGWVVFFGGLSQDSIAKLIPRPRKQKVECEQCRAYEEIGKVMFEGGYPKKQEQLNKQLEQDIDAILWSGTGLPPVGAVCSIQLAFTGYENCEITYMGDGVYCFKYKGTEYTGSIYDTVFRPLKTEAEKERERLEGLLCVMDSIGTWDVKGDTLEESVCDTFGKNTWQELCEALRLGVKVKIEATK